MASLPPTARKVIEMMEAIVPPMAWPDSKDDITHQQSLIYEDTLSQGVHVSLREPPYEGGECSLEDGVVDVE